MTEITTPKAELLAEKATQLANAKSRYEGVRQVLFYVMFGTTLLMLGVVTFLAVRVEGLVRATNTTIAQAADDRASADAAIQGALAQLRSERRTDSNAQTMAIEQFILDIANGKRPQPKPAVVFFTAIPTPRASRSATPSPGGRQPATQPAPRASSSPRPQASPSPAPRPTPRVTCLPRITPVVPNSICI